MPEKEKPKRKRNKPPPIGTVVAVHWVDSGCSHSRVEAEPSDAIIGLVITIGEVIGWYDDVLPPEKNVCVLRTSRWFFPDESKFPHDGEKDLFSIWIPSITKIVEYKKVKDIS